MCETCGVTSIIGTLFCKECGAALHEKLREIPGSPWCHAHLFFADSGREYRLSLSQSEPILIGRADPDEDYWPQVDLTDESGVEKGVSRRHATIRCTPDNQVVLIDWGGVNGTWIDSVRLEPEQPYPLSASSYVRFGALDVHIYLA